MYIDSSSCVYQYVSTPAYICTDQYVSAPVRIYVSIHLYRSIRVCTSTYLRQHTSVPISTCPHQYVSTSAYICTDQYVSTPVRIYVSIHLYRSLRVCTSTYLRQHTSVPISTCLHQYVSTSAYICTDQYVSTSVCIYSGNSWHTKRSHHNSVCNEWSWLAVQNTPCWNSCWFHPHYVKSRASVTSMPRFQHLVAWKLEILIQPFVSQRYPDVEATRQQMLITRYERWRTLVRHYISAVFQFCLSVI